MFRCHIYYASNLGPVTFMGTVLLPVVKFLIKPSNPNTINSRDMKIGIWARWIIRKLHSKFQDSSIAGTLLGPVLLKAGSHFPRVKLQLLNEQE